MRGIGGKSALAGLLVSAVLTLAGLMIPAAASATVTTFCVGTYGGGGYCNQGHLHNIQWISAQASASAFCVMRATEGSAGAPSASGTEYCSTVESGGYVSQSFHGLSGYAQTHNNHSYEVSATPQFEY
jgi:hypothetical protein